MDGDRRQSTGTRQLHRWRRFWREERAVTGTEYAFMLALVIVFALGALTLWSEAEKSIFTQITDTLTTAVGKYL